MPPNSQPELIRGTVAAEALPVSPTSTTKPWALLQFDPGSLEPRMVAEGGRPAAYRPLVRARVASAHLVARRLAVMVEKAFCSAQPQTDTVRPESGGEVMMCAVPVVQGVDAVVAVQMWAGDSDLQVPPRPTVGVVTWSTAGSGVAATDVSAEVLLDTGSLTGATRSLPDLFRHLERIEDRAGLLQMIAHRSKDSHWTGKVSTRGIASGTRRNLSFSAARYDAPLGVVALVTDISDAYPPPPPSVRESLLRAMPAPEGHGIALVDLMTGLIHDWVRPGPSPIDRWQHEIPWIHPDDIAGLSATRAYLIDGLDVASSRWRVRFEPDSPWLGIHSTWQVLTRTPAPQAMLEIHLASPPLSA